MWMTTIIIWTAIIATSINLVYWWFIFSRLAFYQGQYTQNRSLEEPPVSVIICAKNEAENLKKNLPHILNQTYRSFEVIVVNDDSTDTTAQVLLDFQQKNPYLRIINFTNTSKSQVGKKFALTEGINAAQHEVLLLTDADCRPTSELWIKKMQQLIKNKIEIGLGYGPYYNTNGLLNKFIHYETVYTAIQYFSFALCGQTYMGVGRNLIYRKSLFLQTKGFTKHQHIASGDDDLFINQVATRQNVAITLDSDTFMYSDPKETWRQFYRQKMRHLSTGTVYQPKHQVLLGLLSLSHFLHYFCVFYLILQFSTIFAGVIYIVRMLTLLFLYTFILKKFRLPSLWKWIPTLDLMYIMYYVVFIPTLIIGKKNQWT